MEIEFQNVFETHLDQIQERIQGIDPVAYGRTRNFVDGEVTRLSPYISRGLISTKQVMETTLARGFDPDKVEKFLQELAWRDYWQQIWIAKGDRINEDLRSLQTQVEHHEIPAAILYAHTGIEAVDNAIEEFLRTGYMHNHMRMYVASITCNMAHAHWYAPAKWLYYHLLDGDWASNALSWQWVAGTNSNKKYLANQQNINKYFHTDQQGSFLDVTYQELQQIETPEHLMVTSPFEWTTPLPVSQPLSLKRDRPTYIYNYYNLDPNWGKEEDVNRIFLWEPTLFERYPVSQKCVDFSLESAKRNIPDIQIFTGEFNELIEKYQLNDIHFKEHPLNQYSGTAHQRDWMFEVKGEFRSFFAFWKKCKKELK